MTEFTWCMRGCGRTASDLAYDESTKTRLLVCAAAECRAGLWIQETFTQWTAARGEERHRERARRRRERRRRGQ